MTIRLCFVCSGNICRSPTAEAVMTRLVEDRGLAAKIDVDSAGIGDWHTGESADERSADEARRRGFPVTGRARQIRPDDLATFDLLLAMDRSHVRDLQDLTSDPDARRKVRLLRDFDPAAPDGAEVPDPYYGGDRGFTDVFDQILAACVGLLDHVVDRHGLSG